MTTTVKRIEVLVPGQKSKFVMWLAIRGGVAVWQNDDMGNPSAGFIFTPATTQEGACATKPRWSHSLAEVVTDINRFRFTKEVKEVGRCRIALDRELQGTKIVLTSGSSARVRKLSNELAQKHGVDPTYHFEEDEAVFEVPIFED